MKILKILYRQKINHTIHSYWYLCLWLLLLQPLTSAAQKLSLDTIFSKIERQNAGLLSYQYKVKAENELVNGASNWMAPSVSTEWDDVPYKFDAGMSQLRITAMQQFPNQKVIKAKENYLKSLASITSNESEFQKNELIQQAKEAFYNRYIAEQNIIVLEESSKLLAMMIGLAEKQMGIGKLDLGAVYKLKARLSENENMIQREKNMIRTETITLNYLMNEDIYAVFELDTINLIKHYQVESALKKFDSIDCKRSDILRMNSQINSMKLNQTLTSLNSLPTYSVRVGNFTRFGGRADAFAVMGTMSIPIAPWSSKMYKSEVKSMSYSINAMEQNKQNMINMARQMITMNLVEMESQNAQLDNYLNRVIPAYQKSMDANLLSYGQNTSELNMTLMAWDDLQMARLTYLKTLANYLKTQSLYEKALQIK